MNDNSIPNSRIIRNMTGEPVIICATDDIALKLVLVVAQTIAWSFLYEKVENKKLNLPAEHLFPYPLFRTLDQFVEAIA